MNYLFSENKLTDVDKIIMPVKNARNDRNDE